MKILLALLVAAVAAAAPVGAGTSPPRIAFDYGLTTSHPDVVTLAPDGAGLRNLTPGTPDFFTADMHPSWSPDGTRIAFDSHRDSNLSTEIYVMNADGSDQARLTLDSGQSGIFNTLPHWSPRGALIEFEKTVNGQSDDLWVIGPDGNGLRRLTTDGGIKTGVSWSPDGSRLVYTRQETVGSRIYTVGLDGESPRALSPMGAYDADPAWSPDGSEIAFAAPALTVMNADGSNRHRVSDLSVSSPAWSPDGTRIAFAGLRFFPQFGSRFGVPARQDVFLVGADGAGLRRLTGPFGDGRLVGPGGAQPTWWPDGSRLFYLSQHGTGPYTTFEMNADGSCQQQFGPAGPDLQRPVWQPGGGPLPPITHCAELRLTAEPGKSPVAVGEPTSWTVTVDNDGNLTAKNVSLDVTTPDDAQLSATSNACQGNGARVDCVLGGIAPLGSAAFSITAARRTGGPIRLLARVSGTELDTDTTNNDTSSEAQVLPCTVVGTDGADVLDGTPGPDKICGLPGADTIYGGRGNDYVDAGNGDDRIYPGPGRDTVIARGGNDAIYARDGQRDWIDCGAQHDVAIVDRVDVTRHCEVVVRPPR